MNDMLAQWKADKLWGSLAGCWLATVFFSFWGDSLLSVHIPSIGAVYPFRVLLPLTAFLYLVWAIREKDRFWRGATALEKWCCLLGGIMLLYGALSLPRALDLAWTFRRLFNLCFDLCFFFLMLRLCRNRDLFRATLRACAVAVVLLSVCGIYEVFFGGIFNHLYEDIKRFEWFTRIFQSPVVTYSNTNDYCTSLVFLYGVFLLTAEQRQKERLKKWQTAVLTISFPVLFFLISASNARFSLLSLWLLLFGVAVYLLVREPKRLWVPVVIVILFGCIQFANDYRYIVPPIQEYLSQVKEYHQQEGGSDSEKPSLSLGRPNTGSLEEEFFVTNEETGQIEIRNDGNGSGGERTLLLLHALRCFLESHGLGVGLGNTEILARDRQVIINAKIWSIHCFVARVIADFGLFVLIPLCAIGYLLLKRFFQLMFRAIRTRDRYLLAVGNLYLCVLLTYPLLSTAPSDAQDILAMWIYLAAMVLFCRELPAEDSIPVAKN